MTRWYVLVGNEGHQPIPQSLEILEKSHHISKRMMWIGQPLANPCCWLRRKRPKTWNIPKTYMISTVKISMISPWFDDLPMEYPYGIHMDPGWIQQAGSQAVGSAPAAVSADQPDGIGSPRKMIRQTHFRPIWETSLEKYVFTRVLLFLLMSKHILDLKSLVKTEKLPCLIRISVGPRFDPPSLLQYPRKTEDLFCNIPVVDTLW